MSTILRLIVLVIGVVVAVPAQWLSLPVVSGKSIYIDLQGIADRAVHCR